MMVSVNITILVENTTSDARLGVEHGISYRIETDNTHILFDTGQGGVLMRNARELDVNLAKTDAIVLSHGHYDHTGGLADVVSLCGKAKVNVYAHPQAFVPKYGCKFGISKYIGIAEENRNAVFSDSVYLIDTTKPTEISAGIFVTGQIPRVTDFEDVGEHFYLDEYCKEPDLLLDDQAVYFDTDEGIVVLLGCAHAGVINTILYIQRLTNNRPINTVIGGMHLLNADDSRLKETVRMLNEFEVKRVFPAHCTGDKAKNFLCTQLGDRYAGCSTGLKFTFVV